MRICWSHLINCVVKLMTVKSMLRTLYHASASVLYSFEFCGLKSLKQPFQEFSPNETPLFMSKYVAYFALHSDLLHKDKINIFVDKAVGKKLKIYI